MVLNCLGAAETSLGEFKLARQHLEAAIQKDRNAPHPYYNMGRLLLKTGTLAEAKPWFDKALQRGYSADAIVTETTQLNDWLAKIPNIPPVPATPQAGNVPLYQVQMLNDEKTPMAFVVAILEKNFQLTRAQSTNLMLQVHHDGRGICGTYGQLEAEAKVEQVRHLAEQNGFSLTCVAVPAA